MFSTTFKKIWQNAGSPVENYVNVGYVYDNAFKGVLNNHRIDEIKGDFRDHELIL